MSDQPTGSQDPVPMSPAQPATPVVEATSVPHKNPFTNVLMIAAIAVFLAALALVYVLLTRKPASSQLSTQQSAAKQKPLIKLAVNPWQASELNAHVAKVILEEHMGYTVELVPVDEFAQWESLAKGEIHASLEVWPSGHKDNIVKYIDTDKTVVRGGDLGPVGKIGWYVPTYLVNEHPELATWEGFKKPENVKLFAGETGTKGQFTTGDPTWTQYDDQIIKNLGLPFEVKVLGSEDALIQLLDETYVSKKPIVFYFWTPHWAHAMYDLTPVQLPAYTDDCYKDLKGGVDCDYPKEQLLKVFWSGLAAYDSGVYEFLSKINYTNEDQIRMLAALQQKKLSPEEVARNWVRSNEGIWQLWTQ